MNTSTEATKETTNENYRILLIDDNQSIHDDFKKILCESTSDKNFSEMERMLFNEAPVTQDEFSKISFSLDSALSGEDGITLVKKSITEKTPYALVIIDVRMPGGIDGVETAKIIFEIEDRIHVIICSAFSDYDWKKMLKMIQHPDRWLILKKPFDVIEVRQMALSLCRKWALQCDMQGQLSEQTHQIQNTNKKLQEQVQALQKAQKEIHQLAYYDSLTGLPNRFFFKELLIQSLHDADRNNTLVGLFFLDLDDFKKINDSMGHGAGDELLKQVTERLNAVFRKSDFVGRFKVAPEQHLVTSARLGGDEFTVILRNFTEVDDLLVIANRVATIIGAKPYRIHNKDVTTSVSAGVSVYPQDAKEPNELIKCADIAMYQAKAQGKNKIALYNKVLSEKIKSKNKLELEMHGGFDRQEFFMVYQPKMSLKKKSIIGCEALIRWQHPTHGVMDAGKFIPIAEESDFIIEVDQYVMEKVFQQMAEWKKLKECDHLIVSINLSARFFQAKHLVPFITDLVQKYDIQPHNLELEITESYLIHEREKVVSRLKELRELFGGAVKVSVDDFGTGYSSLSYLSTLPIDTLKIDQSFIRQLPGGKHANSIVKAIIDLSHNLDYGVIAEGVETWNQLQFLKDARCDEVQGFFLGKPMTADKFVDFIKSWKAGLTDEPVS